MYTFTEPTPELLSLNEKCKRLVAEITSEITPKNKDLKISQNKPLAEPDKIVNSIYVLKQGTVSYTCGDKKLFFQDEGDLVGLESCFGHSNALIESDFAVIVDEYDISDFLNAIHKNKELAHLWDNYLVTHITLLNSMLSGAAVCELGALPDIKIIPANTMIFEVGTVPSEVYTLVEGEAEVRNLDQFVRLIDPDETFGLMSILTGGSKAASVYARTDCVLMALPKDDYINALNSRPNVAVKLLKDIADLLKKSQDSGSGIV